jgi:NTE family protein
VGLALAGGGARGGAHIGVLKVLEELRIPIDCIAGTSMGALVGGGYASGMPAKDIEQFVTSVDWKSVVGGVGSRSLEPVEQKRFDDAGGAIALGLKGGKIVPPAGIIATSRIEDVIRTFVASARSVADFNQLPIPYRAVATDMLTGNMVVLDHGDIATAMRASMAIPGAFAPVVTEQYVLSDGFVVRNLPIDVVRGMCADIVIAVNLVKPPVTREQLVGPASLISRSNDVMSEANERLQLQTLTDRDIRIDVDLGGIGAADFERTAQTIAFGEKATRAMAKQLAALSVSEQDYAAWRRHVTVNQDLRIKIAGVEFQGLKHVNPEYLRTVTRVHAGDAVDITAISHDAARMAALDDLDGVDYRLSGDPSNPVLIWQPRERQIGQDYLRPNTGLYGAGAGDFRFNLGIEYVLTWLNAYGAQWRNLLQIGSTTIAQTSLYQPLETAQTFFVEPIVAAGRSIEDIYDDYKRIAQYLFIDYGGRLDFGLNLDPHSQLRVGYLADRRHVEVDTGSTFLPTGQFTDAGFAATAFYDSRESATFATKGLSAEIDYSNIDNAFGANRSWQTIEAAARQAVRTGRLTMVLTAAGGSDLGSSLPADRAFSLGGPQSFPGYAMGEVRSRSYWSLQGDVRWRVADILSIANQALYSGLELQGARAYDRLDTTSSGALYGISGYLGGRTPLGTLTFGVGKATGDWSIWITLGTPVSRGSILDKPLFR